MRRLVALFGLVAVFAIEVCGQVTYQRLVQAAKTPEDWLTYAGNLNGQRFSRLSEISAANVSRLHVKWVYQMAGGGGRQEGTPIVSGDVMYTTESPSTVVALDVRTGRSLWRWERPIPADLKTLGFGRSNRGVAILGDKIFVGTLDAHMVALDAKTGAMRWDTKVADYKTSHCITGAPLAINGMILTGVSGGEAGIRGFIDAYDAETGERRWRTWTVPGPGEAGHETWGTGESWKTGGGPTWITGAYDPELNLIYWGTGNPGPDWNGDERPGDNLYTCSMLAIDPASGTIKWHFQFTPHDDHDWDSAQTPMLFESTVQGQPRKLVALANRNGFYYVLDRTNGKFVTGKAFAKQTWAKGLDDAGRAQVLPGVSPTKDGNLVYPSLQGATNWFSSSLDPDTGFVYVPVREMGSYFFKTEPKYVAGAMFTGGGERVADKEKLFGNIRALDARTGTFQWDFRLQSPPWGGVMSTAGGVVFGGTNEGNFFALDAKSGKSLWDFQTGGPIGANPMSFATNGHQRIAIVAARSLFVFALD